MWRLALLALPALAGADWLAKAESALAAAKPNRAALAAAGPTSAEPPALPRFLTNRRLDQTVDYDAACLTAFGQCEALATIEGRKP